MDELFVFLVVVLALALGYAVYQNYYTDGFVSMGEIDKKEGFWPGGWRRGSQWPGWRYGRRGWGRGGWWPGYYGYNYPYGYYPQYYY